jgi:hypothetical protein
VSAADCVAVDYARVMSNLRREYPLDAKAVEAYVAQLQAGIRALRQEGGWQHVVSITAECLEQAKSSHRTLPVVSARSPLRGDNWIPLYALTPSPKGPTT